MTDLRGRPIAARDGRVGWLNDLHFDLRSWSIRYLVIETGEWLAGREARISPASLVKNAGDAEVISTCLRRALIEAAATLYDAKSLCEPWLGSMSQLVACRIDGPDGPIGLVEDLLVDDRGWIISDLLVNASEWLAAHILLPPHAVRKIEWDKGVVRVPFTRGELEALHRQYLRIQRRACDGTHITAGN